MAGKRNASSDLNHDNWDQEEESEDAGTFKRASEDVLKKRVIKTARRRAAPGTTESESGEKKSAFGGFTAFSKAPANPSSAFSFLKSSSPMITPNVNGTDKKQTPSSPQQTIESDDFLAKLKGLNESVTKWIKKHVDENPFINLKPIFNDYEKYFNEIEHEKNKKPIGGVGNLCVENVNSTKNDTVPQFSFGVKKGGEEPKNSDFSFGNKKPENVLSFSDKKPEFSFGAKPVEKEKLEFTFSAKKVESGFSFRAKKAAPEIKPQFNFGAVNKGDGEKKPDFSFGSKKTESDKPTTGFNFNSTPFKFGSNNIGTDNSVITSTPAVQKEEKNEVEDEPPKVEFTPVVEEDHVYTSECKVFVKKDSNYGDRGLGTLYLKPVPDSEKTQLIVRANTNLGNLLCNFILSSAIPTQRMGKKDVMLVCIPTPDSKPPPVPILIRVKTPEKADELLKTLEKYKK